MISSSSSSSLPKIVNFDQGASVAGRGQIIPPYNYYNPQVFLAKEAFDLFPGEECLAIINGIGYRYNDDTIYHITCSTNNDDDECGGSSNGGGGGGGEDTVDGVSSGNTTGSNVHLKLESESQLCIFVKNCSLENAFKIGYNTPLNWLLDMPRIMSKLCYCSMTDLIKIKRLLGRPPKINSEMLTTMNETIVIQ